LPLDKRQREEPGHNTGYGDSVAETEVAARAVNAQPWSPPPGMAKLRCTRCYYFFAAPGMTLSPTCPDCTSLGTETANSDQDPCRQPIRNRTERPD
jgi:hypothetical protein